MAVMATVFTMSGTLHELITWHILMLNRMSIQLANLGRGI